MSHQSSPLPRPFLDGATLDKRRENYHYNLAERTRAEVWGEGKHVIALLFSGEIRRTLLFSKISKVS